MAGQHVVGGRRRTRVNADNSDKKAVLAFWTVFAVLLAAVLASSNFTPSALLFKSNRSELQDTQHSQCTNPVTFEKGLLVCQDFSIHNPRLGLVLRNLSPLNQFAQINLLLLPDSPTAQSLELRQAMEIELVSLRRKSVASGNRTLVGFERGEEVRTVKVEFDSRNYALEWVVSDEARVEQGYQLNLGFYRHFRTQDALLVVRLTDPDWQLLTGFRLALTAVLVNDNYTKFVISMRAVFLVVAVASTAAFVYRLRVARGVLLPEQRVVVGLSVGVVLFNDPYYFIAVFYPNLFSILLETLFVAGFAVALVASWVVMLEQIAAESGRPAAGRWRHWVQGVAAAAIFALVFAFNYQIGYYEYTSSPIVPAHSVFSWLFVAAGVVFGLVLVYVGWLYVGVWRAWADVIWRHRLYAVFNVFFVVLILLFNSLGWFSLYDESSQKFEILYASLNIYVLYLQFMYTRPFGQQQKQQHPQQFYELQEVNTEAEEKMDAGAVVDLDGRRAVDLNGRRAVGLDSGAEKLGGMDQVSGREE